MTWADGTCVPVVVRHKDTHEAIAIDPEEIDELEPFCDPDNGPFVLVKTKSPHRPNVPVREDLGGLLAILAKAAPAVLAALTVKLIDHLWQR